MYKFAFISVALAAVVAGCDTGTGTECDTSDTAGCDTGDTNVDQLLINTVTYTCEADTSSGCGADCGSLYDYEITVSGANSGGVVLINQDTADDWEETHDLTGTGTTLTASLVGAHVADQTANVSTLFQCGMATLMVWRYEVYTPDNVLADCVVASGSETDPSAFYTLDTDGSGNFEGCANSNLW